MKTPGATAIRVQRRAALVAATLTAAVPVGLWSTSRAPSTTVVAANVERCEGVALSDKGVEERALAGQLTGQEVRCLEDGLQMSTRFAERCKRSLLLIANANGVDDLTEWDRLALRHLIDIDAADAKSCARPGGADGFYQLM